MTEQVEKLFVTTCDRILISLLQQGECPSGVLAQLAGIHPVHLSRLLPWLQDNGFIFSRRFHGPGFKGGIRRIIRSTSKGRQMAEMALRRKEMLKKPLGEKEVRELKFWAGKF
jgi:DNA-binding PadR family transcriptional regulator